MEDQIDTTNQALPGPVAPLRPVILSVRLLPPPPGLSLNLPRVPPNAVQYSAPTSGGLSVPPPRPPGMPMMPVLQPPPPPVPMTSSGQPPIMGSQPLQQMPQMSVNPAGSIPGPPPESQFMPVPAPRPPFVSIPFHQTGIPLMPHPPPQLSVGMPDLPTPEEAPPPLPEEPEPKRQKPDDSLLNHEDQFLAQHLGPARINISVPNVDEGNLKGQGLEISVQSLLELVGSLKEKIAGGDTTSSE